MEGVDRWRHGPSAPWAPWDGWRRSCNDPWVVLTTRIILWGIVLAQLTDALTFTIGVSRFGIDLESNGLAAWLLTTSGLDGVLIAKLAVLLTTIGLLIATATRFPRLLVWGGAAATSIGLLGFATNSASILLLS
jgi:hypothetical protein